MSLHADALGLLREWAAPTPEQELLRKRFVAHLGAHPDGMTRECYPDHLTASTLVVSPDVGRVMLTLHARAREWFQFGGHCEAGDETLLAAGRREAREESGLSGLVLDPAPLRLDEHPVPFCDPRGGVRHLDVWFLAVAPGDAEPVRTEESLDVRWWPAGAMPPGESWAEPLALARQRLGLP